ncbi:uncharacterized protein SPPG_05710 [Spizellomyces punctatus DAOM BR117]|uniref:Uncharacterized protein n=1 Tax=Spizellomyces punctatus (strain DAOM BR117) TaxID=645134 RepID=A0A0L0HDA4_SPIPD|nr:uncharacterized protein SPPG_05710 [Spizellomyces punctatus DAOM BR117]KNC99475.1 hypothetical protein SPPG_05710 [Spizellomyces punctatus DAOM BR117]|eukprot:XP_016607515.1 hypothetical protein SPPG_05710 [Spizellomyces punctatus DAOM BR117]
MDNPSNPSAQENQENPPAYGDVVFSEEEERDRKRTQARIFASAEAVRRVYGDCIAKLTVDDKGIRFSLK